jgi:hypothetical protein
MIQRSRARTHVAETTCCLFTKRVGESCAEMGRCPRPWFLIILTTMAKENPPPKAEPTPFDKFTEAARHVFNLPKDQVEKVKAKYPTKTSKSRKRKPRA